MMFTPENYSAKISRLDHVTLEVRDITKALHFYTDILGLKEINTPEEIKLKGICWLGLPNKQAIHLIEIKDMKEPSSSHLALVVDDIEAWEKHLTENSIPLQPPKFDIYNAKRFFIKDPFGNRIEFLKWLS